MPNTWDKQSNNPYVNAGNSIGQMIAMMAGGGENIRAKAEAEGALSAAQAYSQNMLGNERWANARGLNMTADNRASIPAMIATAGESMPQYKRDALEMFGLTGDTNMDRFASAMQRTQQVDYADRALANPSQRANLAAALAAGAGKQMFDNVGNTGVAQNRYTGEMNVANQALLDLFSNLESSKVTENNAQANAANALADVRKQEVANGGAGGGSAHALRLRRPATAGAWAVHPRCDGPHRRPRGPLGAHAGGGLLAGPLLPHDRGFRPHHRPDLHP